MPRVAREFWSLVREDGECWVWSGRLEASGYGRRKTAVGLGLVHRIAYEEMVGEIPEGLQIDHLCRNRACVRPDHLDPVPCRTNLLRSDLTQAHINATKTTCERAGHPLSGANLYVCPRGRRECRACRSEANRRSMARRATNRRG